MTRMKIADVRHTLAVPGNSLAAVMRAVQCGFNEVLVEPVFSDNGNGTLSAFLGDYSANIRSRLYQESMGEFFSENRLLETPEPLSSVLYIPRLTLLWCLFNGPVQYASAATHCLSYLGRLMPELPIGFLSLTAEITSKIDGVILASPSPASDYVVMKRPIDHLSLLWPRFRKRAISLLPWSMGAHRQIVTGHF